MYLTIEQFQSLKIGDVVRIKSVEELRNEFPSSNEASGIFSPLGFGTHMLPYCGTEITIDRSTRMDEASIWMDWYWHYLVLDLGSRKVLPKL